MKKFHRLWNKMFVLFDIGGTKTRIAISKNLQDFSGEPIIFDTPQNFEAGLEKISNALKKITNGEPLKFAGGGIAGPLDKNHEKLVNALHLPNWINKPLKTELEKIFGCPVIIENDSAVSALGEAHFGAGKGKKIIAYVTISTGVGGARIVNGNIDQNIFGFEPGAGIIDLDKTLVKTAKFGSAEEYLSGTSTEKEFGVRAKEMTEEIWNELAVRLSAVIKNVISFWSPEIVVLGGGMMVKKPGGIDLEKVKTNISETFKIFPQYSEIKKAELGDLGGLYGSLILIKKNFS